MTFIKANSIRTRLLINTLLVVLFFAASLPAHAQSTPDTTIVEEETDEDSISLDENDKELHNKDEEVYPATMRAVPDSVTDRLKKSKDFEYANDPEYWTEKVKAKKADSRRASQPRRKDAIDGISSFFLNDSVRMFFYLLIGAILLYAIYRIVVVNNLFMSRRSTKLADQQNGEFDEIESTDPDERINKAIADKNYRLAVRYLYLKSLQLLNDKGWIRFHAQATNHEYVLQVSKYPVANEFRFLTEAYDYVWYGEFALTDSQFEIVHNNFRNFHQAIR